jgi:hypothetical protein
VKNLKFAVAGFGALGVVALIMLKLIPDGFKADFVEALLFSIGIFAGLGAGIAGIVKAPYGRVHGIVATAGFGLAFIKWKFYKLPDVFKGFGDAPTEVKLLVIAVLGGLIVSIISLVKPEEG